MSCAKVVSQFEVIAAGELGRRRTWSDAEKIRIVEESYRGHRQGSVVARRYGISRALLTQWRRAVFVKLVVPVTHFQAAFSAGPAERAAWNKSRRQLL